MPYDPMEGFKIGQAVGSSKKSALSRTSDYMSDLTKERDSSKNKLNPLELIVAKQAIQPSTGVYSWDPTSGQLSQEASVPKGSIVRNTVTPDDIYNRTQAKNKATIDPLVQSGENVLKTSVAAFKQMAQNNPLGAGRGAGVMNWLGGKTGLNPAVNAYKGLKVESATELAKIANPSGRGGPEIVKEFEALLPDDFTNWEEFANKFHYAAQNAFARQAAYLGKPYDPSEYESKIQEILDTPAFKQMEVANNNPLMSGINSSNKSAPNKVTPEDALAELRRRGKNV